MLFTVLFILGILFLVCMFIAHITHFNGKSVYNTDDDDAVGGGFVIFVIVIVIGGMIWALIVT